MSKATVTVSNVWKVFGDYSGRLLSAIQDGGLGKQEALERYNCVIGVADASFTVEPGQIYCIMGLSGSGKSTLVRHINRLLEPTSGQIFINDIDVLAIDDAELQAFRNRHIAMVFQNFALMPHRSVLDNIAMPLEIRGMSKNERLAVAEQNLHLVELGGWGNKFAHELSGGMQQRVGLARALASDTDILLMDEPFSALDPLIRRQLQNQFMSLSEIMQKTTIFITHDLEEAVRIGNRIAIMRDGRIIQEDTPENIILNPANDYIADFVAGISRLNVVHAQAVMTPLAEFEAQHGGIGADHPTVADSTPLKGLISAMLKHQRPLVVVDDAGGRVGVVTQQELFQSILDDGEGDA